LTFELLDHQSIVLPKLDSGKVLVGGTGSGKSITGLSFFTGRSTTKPIYVITTAKKRDSGEWFEDAMKMSLRNPLYVDSWNNIEKYADIKDAYFIFDEQRVVGKGAWTHHFYSITRNQNEWLLLSATPADTWVDLVPLFIANGYYKNRSQFDSQHVRYVRYAKFPKIDGYLDVPLLEHYRNQLFVEMPFQNSSLRVEHFVSVDFDLDDQRRLFTDRWNILEDKPLKDAGEMMRMLRRFTNSHRSRYEAVKTIMRDNPRAIIFYNHNYELEILRCLMTDLDIPMAEWNGHVHQDVPIGPRWIYLVQYQAGGEGWNCITTDTTIFYSLPYSYRNFEQAKGRIDRLNTQYESLHYYILKSKSIIDRAIWRALNRKKNFQASAFKRQAWPDAA
jgi:hypothetical protein